MKNTNLLRSAQRVFGRSQLFLKKHGPSILIFGGIAAAAAGTVVACKETFKAKEIVEDCKRDLVVVHDLHENGIQEVNPTEEIPEYTDSQYKKDLVKIYAATGFRLVKNYAPAIILEGAGFAAILGGHKMFKVRVAALASSYASLKSCYDKYREAIKEKYGEDVDRETAYGVKKIDVTQIDENGKKKKDKLEIVDGEGYSPYARFFDASSMLWEKSPEYNLMTLKNVEKWANDRLQAFGHVFLNEVYDELGLKRSTAGQHVGWFYDEQNPVLYNYISFGIFNYKRPANRDFVNGFEPVILLDFNVDGDISEMI